MALAREQERTERGRGRWRAEQLEHRSVRARRDDGQVAGDGVERELELRAPARVHRGEERLGLNAVRAAVRGCAAMRLLVVAQEETEPLREASALALHDGGVENERLRVEPRRDQVLGLHEHHRLLGRQARVDHLQQGGKWAGLTLQLSGSTWPRGDRLEAGRVLACKAMRDSSAARAH